MKVNLIYTASLCVILLTNQSATFAQTVHETVVNAAGQSVSLQSFTCSGATCTSPPPSIASSSTSSNFDAVADSSHLPSMISNYGFNKSGQLYACGFSASTGKDPVSGACYSPNYSPGATNGQYPSPHCTTVSHSQNSVTCDFTVQFQIAQ